MDSITKGQRNLLLFLLGIAILVLPIRFLAMGNFDDKKSIESQYNERQTIHSTVSSSINVAFVLIEMSNPSFFNSV